MMLLYQYATTLVRVDAEYLAVVEIRGIRDVDMVKRRGEAGRRIVGDAALLSDPGESNGDRVTPLPVLGCAP